MADACNRPRGFDAGAALRITDPASIWSVIESLNSLPFGELGNIGERGRQVLEPPVSLAKSCGGFTSRVRVDVRCGRQTSLHRRLIIFPEKNVVRCVHKDFIVRYEIRKWNQIRTMNARSGPAPLRFTLIH